MSGIFDPPSAPATPAAFDRIPAGTFHYHADSTSFSTPVAVASGAWPASSLWTANPSGFTERQGPPFFETFNAWWLVVEVTVNSYPPFALLQFPYSVGGASGTLAFDPSFDRSITLGGNGVEGASGDVWLPVLPGDSFSLSVYTSIAVATTPDMDADIALYFEFGLEPLDRPAPGTCSGGAPSRATSPWLGGVIPPGYNTLGGYSPPNSFWRGGDTDTWHVLSSDVVPPGGYRLSLDAYLDPMARIGVRIDGGAWTSYAAADFAPRFVGSHFQIGLTVGGLPVGAVVDVGAQNVSGALAGYDDPSMGRASIYPQWIACGGRPRSASFHFG